MSKINKTKKESSKSINKLLAPPKKKFIRKKIKVKGKTEMQKTNENFIKNRNEKKSNTFKAFKFINLDIINSSNNKINKISPKTNKTEAINPPETKIGNINDLPYFQAI